MYFEPFVERKKKKKKKKKKREKKRNNNKISRFTPKQYVTVSNAVHYEVHTHDVQNQYINLM